MDDKDIYLAIHLANIVLSYPKEVMANVNAIADPCVVGHQQNGGYCRDFVGAPLTLGV